MSEPLQDLASDYIYDVALRVQEEAYKAQRIAAAAAKRERKATRRLILQGRGGYIHVRPAKA